MLIQHVSYMETSAGSFGNSHWTSEVDVMGGMSVKALELLHGLLESNKNLKTVPEQIQKLTRNKFMFLLTPFRIFPQYKIVMTTRAQVWVMDPSEFSGWMQWSTLHVHP